MLLALFLFFLKLGFISFGGGYPMMSFILQEGQLAVGLTTQEFADMTALELLASGPIAINAATYIGFIKAGLPGAFIATIGVCLPSFILTAILYSVLTHFKENKYVQGSIDAIKIACGGILITASLTLAQNILVYTDNLQEIAADITNNIQWGGILIAVICVVAIKKFKANPIAMILVSAVLGIFLL